MDEPTAVEELANFETSCASQRQTDGADLAGRKRLENGCEALRDASILLQWFLRC